MCHNPTPNRVAGIPEAKREAAQRDMCRETMSVSRDGDYYVFRIISPVGARENRFKPGEEYSIETSFASFTVSGREGRDGVQNLLAPMGTLLWRVQRTVSHAPFLS